MGFSGQMSKVRVERVAEIATGVYILEFQRFFEFEAGQIISISTGEDMEPRLYSIASGEKEDRVQVLFNVVKEGRLTPALSDLKEGDALWTSPGFGRFTGTPGKAWWIAQGTGIAPFLSMFRSGQVDNKVLVHGGRYEESFYFSGEFQPVLGEQYVRCCSKGEAPGLFHGRVTDYLRSVTELPADARYYLCGSSEMVVETRDILISRGISFRNIVGEIYF